MDTSTTQSHPSAAGHDAGRGRVDEGTVHISERRLSPQALITGSAGALLAIALFLPWYTATARIGGAEDSISANAWRAFSTIDVVLLLVAVVAILLAAAQAADAVPPAQQAIAHVAGVTTGALGLALILYRLLEFPVDDVSSEVELGRGIGGFVALIAAVTVTFGNMKALFGTAGRR